MELDVAIAIIFILKEFITYYELTSLRAGRHVPYLQSAGIWKTLQMNISVHLRCPKDYLNVLQVSSANVFWQDETKVDLLEEEQHG